MKQQRNHPLKRAFDVAVALGGLLVAGPVLVVAMVLIKVTSRGPVFFRQPRRGRDGQVFLLYKLRTMVDRPRTAREIMPGDTEVTTIGRVLRRFKIDELPQLWNVLTGDMAIVGPRPGLPDQPLSEVGRRRLEVRPGLTGLAQVHGNVYLTWEQRWEYDAAYVDRMSIGMDLWILWRTVLVVLLGEKRFSRPFPQPSHE